MPESQVPAYEYFFKQLLGCKESCVYVYGNKVEKFSQGEAWHCPWCYMATSREIFTSEQEK